MMDELAKLSIGMEFRTYNFHENKYIYVMIKCIKDKRFGQYPFEFVYVRKLEAEEKI